MAGVEVIGLLCAGSVDYRRVAGRSSDDGLTRAEIAGLLSGMDYLTMHFALAKYACDEVSIAITVSNVRAWLVGVAVFERWHVRDKAVIDNIGSVAVYEAVKPNACAKCNGTGIIGGPAKRYDFKAGMWRGVGGVAKQRKCARCDGTGYGYLSGRQVSDAIGIDECNYRRTWRHRYDRAIGRLNDVDNDVRCCLSRADK